MNSYLQARKNMVTNQVMPAGVHDQRLIEALIDVPKHQYVDTKWQVVAYSDAKLRLSNKRYTIKPEEFSQMVQALKLTGEERVLDVACGTGYSTSVLAKLASQVLGLESEPDLATKASNSLAHHKIINAVVKVGDVLVGDHKNAPYDAIFVNVCLDKDPVVLLEQLVLSGRLVCSLDIGNGIKKAYVFQNLGDSFSKIEICESSVEKFY